MACSDRSPGSSRRARASLGSGEISAQDSGDCAHAVAPVPASAAVPATLPPACSAAISWTMRAELRAAVELVGEHAERGAAGREQHRVAGLRRGRAPRASPRAKWSSRARIARPRASSAACKRRGGGAFQQHHAPAARRDGGRQLREIRALVGAPGDQDDRPARSASSAASVAAGVVAVVSLIEAHAAHRGDQFQAVGHAAERRAAPRAPPSTGTPAVRASAAAQQRVSRLCRPGTRISAAAPAPCAPPSAGVPDQLSPSR